MHCRGNLFMLHGEEWVRVTVKLFDEQREEKVSSFRGGGRAAGEKNNEKPRGVKSRCCCWGGIKLGGDQLPADDPFVS